MNRKVTSAFVLMFQILCGFLILTQTAFSAGLVQDKRLEFTLPVAPWTMTLPAKDFEIAEQQVKPDGSGAYFFLTSEQSHLNVSFYLESASKCKNSKACRDMVRKLGNPAWGKPQNLISSELGDVSYFEFLVPSFQGQPVRQQNMYAEFVVDGFWVDLHISKVLYKPEDHSLFEQLVKAIKFEPKTVNETAKLTPLAANAPEDQPVKANLDEKKFDEAIKPYVEQARKTYAEVKARFLAGLPSRHVFFVTARLHDSAGRWEQVFVEVKEISGGKIKGLIANDIQNVSGYKLGNSFTFPESELLDWTISKPDGTEEGNIVGKFLETYHPE